VGQRIVSGTPVHEAAFNYANADGEKQGKKPRNSAGLNGPDSVIENARISSVNF
jgi:hypothetical protein